MSSQENMASIGCKESINPLPIISQAYLTSHLNTTQLHLTSLNFLLERGQFLSKLKQFCFILQTLATKEGTTKEANFLLYQHDTTDERIWMIRSINKSVNVRHDD